MIVSIDNKFVHTPVRVHMHLLSYKLKKSPSTLIVPNAVAMLPLCKATAILSLKK